MISRARPLCVFMKATSSSASGLRPLLALEQLRGAENRLQRVVQLVRDAGHEQADGGEPLLAHDLPLQRLQHLAHLALLAELTVERVARVAQVLRHRDEGGLQLVELEVRRPHAFRRREIAVGDALGGQRAAG